MCSANKIHVVLLQEPRHHVGPERKRDTAIVLAPASNVLVWIGPQQITKQTAVGDLHQSAGRCTSLCGPQSAQNNVVQNMRATYICRAHDSTDLLHRIQVWTQASVHGEDLLINDSCDWQAVEAIGECLPQLDVISPLTFIIESVDPIDRCTLVVSP